LGPLTPAAQHAHVDFARLAAEEPSSLYFEDFLRCGFAAWPVAHQRRYPALAAWRGVGGLKESLKELAGAPPDCSALVASQSSSLVKLAASCLFRVCQNVLTTDLSWPFYQQTLADRADLTRNYVTVATIRDRIFHGGWSGADIAEYLAAQFVRYGCDGLFLPVVDHLGVRLPIDRIVRRVRASGELRFVMLDAAQAFCHVAFSDVYAYADFIVAGCHKWMGGYLPLGVAFFGQRQSRELIERRVRRQLKLENGDALCSFVEHLDRDSLNGHSQTVSLPALFTAAGAVQDQQRLRHLQTPSGIRMKNPISMLPNVEFDFRQLRVAPEFQSRVAIVRHVGTNPHTLSANCVRRLWLSAGCIVTGYQGGLARLAFAHKRPR